jgi:hypothetical protein
LLFLDTEVLGRFHIALSPAERPGIKHSQLD